MRTLALALLIAALAVGGCGDGGEETTPASQDATTTAPDRAEEDSRGGEKSIEEFGEEAAGADRGSILGTFDGYLEAVAEEDAAAACSYLSATVQRSLKQLVARGKENLECAQILPRLLAPTAATVAREQARGEVTRVRVEGDQAFVVFRAPGAKLYVLGLVDEDGEWKATTIAASVLVPDL